MPAPRPRAPFASIALIAAAAACVPSFTEDGGLVAKRRLLAVRSVPAEAPPGATVALEALVAAPVRQDPREGQLAWSMCVARKPLTELGPVAQACVDPAHADPSAAPPIGAGAGVEARLPGDACRLFGPLRPPAEAGGVAGRAVDPDVSGGYYQPVVVDDREGELTLASVRLRCDPTGVRNAEVIRFNQGYRPNENPAIERLEATVDGAVLPIEPGTDAAGAVLPAGATVELRALWPACPREAVCGDGLCSAGENQTTCAEDCRDQPRGCAGSEIYLYADPNAGVVRARREGITASWYATAGRFAEERSGRTETDPDGLDAVNRFTAPEAPGDVLVWLVLRDDRGGVGWQAYRIAVAPR